MTLRDSLRRLDWLLLASVVVLTTLGGMAIASVALSHDPPDWHNMVKHLLFIVAGLIIIFVGASLDYRALRGWSRLTYVGGALLLLTVLFWGAVIRGTRGWFSFGGITWQPVELVKFFFLIFLARYFEHWARESNRLRHILISGLGACIYIALVALQPDAGSAFLLFAVWVGMLVVVGIRFRHLLLLGCVAFVVGLLAWTFLFHDYQRDRLRTFFQPEKDPLGRGYNIVQARIAIGSGQFFGRGFGFGSQSQLRFLPEAETDFVFAVVSEELGFIGSTLLLAAWAFFFARLFAAVRRCRDDFGLFFLIGALLLFFVEVSVTIGMNVGLLPVTGTTLPFVSYGGSSFLAHSIILSVIQSIIVRSRSTA